MNAVLSASKREREIEGEREIEASGVTIGPADPALQGDSALEGVDGQKLWVRIKSPTYSDGRRTKNIAGTISPS